MSFALLQLLAENYRRSQAGPKGPCPPKFLAYLVILCFEKRRPRQIFGLVTPLLRTFTLLNQKKQQQPNVIRRPAAKFSATTTTTGVMFRCSDSWEGNHSWASVLSSDRTVIPDNGSACSTFAKRHRVAATQHCCSAQAFQHLDVSMPVTWPGMAWHRQAISPQGPNKHQLRRCHADVVDTGRAWSQ